MFGPFHSIQVGKTAGYVAALAFGWNLSAEPLHVRIDDLVKAKAEKAPFAEVADDASFLRRISLDLTGNIPTAKEVSAFLGNKNPGKRAKLIDELLDGPTTP